MDTNTANLIGTCVIVLGQIITTYLVYKVKHATNGMKKELEAVKFAAGVLQGEQNVAAKAP